ncbi:MAG: hypothetical protein NTV80_06265 [Verrucomicrobia bacterium]|nr:hypothetical protein [Verrucomicrobiota bacterium]
MQPNIEPFSQACLPLVESLFAPLVAYASIHAPELNVACSGIHENGPVYANAALSLEAAYLQIPDVTLGVGFFMWQPSASESLLMRLEVGWYRSWTRDEQAGFSICEFSAADYFTDVARAAHWTSAQLPRVESAARSAIRRGHPPRLIEHIWQRLTRRIPRPMIMTLPFGSLARLPKLDTFVSLYESHLANTKG